MSGRSPPIPNTLDGPTPLSLIPGSRSHSQSFELENAANMNTDQSSAVSSHGNMAQQRPKGITTGVARHTLGLLILLCVMFLWTLSNFLGSSIFADDSFARPFFLTYLNNATFVFGMLPSLLHVIHTKSRAGTLKSDAKVLFTRKTLSALFQSQSGVCVEGHDHTNHDEREGFLKPDDASNDAARLDSDPESSTSSLKGPSDQFLGLLPTARLALAFCMLWFGANYFAMACLQHTTVASTTILTSTSSVWTLLVGAISRTEKFTWRKLFGVLASLGGILIISRVDLSSKKQTATNPGSASLSTRALDEFPDKPKTELALGDAEALLSAIIYGFYTITLKRASISAIPLELHMPTFFGLVGAFNVVLLFPLFPILHWTNVEPFSLPPNAHIWLILIVNSISSFISDVGWAYAMVLTSPLVVTVGMSLGIPLSLVGEMIIQGRYERWTYWVGAMVVVGSFVFVDREEVKEEVVRDDAVSYADDRLSESAESSNAVRRRGVHARNSASFGLIDSEDDETDAIRDRLQQQIDGYSHEAPGSHR